MDQLYFNGYVYNLVPDPGPEGRAILERNAGLNGTIVTSFLGWPAVIVGGRLYTQGVNILPGSQGIWDWFRSKER